MNLVPIIKGQDFTDETSGLFATDPELQKIVAGILSRVIQEGDAALLDYTEKFDRVKLESLRVPLETLHAAEAKIDAETRAIFEEAIQNIREFHRHQIQESWHHDFEDGSRLGEIVRPIDRAGIYVPGGKAFYPSSMIMNAVPAQLAGVASIAVASPPGPNGLPHELVLGICSMLGIDEVYSMGGAQAVAALAYGTESIAPVCKVTGPGNKFVAEAKRQVFGKVGIDSIAGPSEILILHDDLSVPIEYLVRDMISQAEHDEVAQAILITTSQETAEKVQKRLDELVPTLPRKEIITASLSGYGKIIVVDLIEEGIDICNQIAPEHLEVLFTDESKLDLVRNAGAIFVGQWSSEPVGDYFAGPNHTIPTSGSARYAAPLSVRDFQKHSSLIRYSKERLLNQGEKIARFADMEELNGHAEAIRERLRRNG